MITQVININSMSQHISLEISKKNPRWVELKGKIWPNSTINKVPLTWPASPWENWMMNIKKFWHYCTFLPPPPCYWWLIMKKHGWKLYYSPNPNLRGGDESAIAPKFHGAVQSNNMLFCRLQHMKFWWEFLINLFL